MKVPDYPFAAQQMQKRKKMKNYFYFVLSASFSNRLFTL